METKQICNQINSEYLKNKNNKKSLEKWLKNLVINLDDQFKKELLVKNYEWNNVEKKEWLIDQEIKKLRGEKKMIREERKKLSPGRGGHRGPRFSHEKELQWKMNSLEKKIMGKEEPIKEIKDVPEPVVVKNEEPIKEVKDVPEKVVVEKKEDPIKELKEVTIDELVEITTLNEKPE